MTYLESTHTLKHHLLHLVGYIKLALLINIHDWGVPLLVVHHHYSNTEMSTQMETMVVMNKVYMTVWGLLLQLLMTLATLER